MTKELLKILHDCEAAGIKNESAEFYCFGPEGITYSVDLPNGDIHCFTVKGQNLKGFAKERVVYLIGSTDLDYLHYTVTNNGKIIKERVTYCSKAPTSKEQG